MDPQFLCTSSGYNCNQISSLNQLLWLLCFSKLHILFKSLNYSLTLLFRPKTNCFNESRDRIYS